MTKEIEDYTNEELEKFVVQRKKEKEARKAYNKKRNAYRKVLEAEAKKRGLM